MSTKWPKIVVPILGTTTTLAAGAAVAVPLVILKKAESKVKSIISEIIPMGGPSNSLANKEKINFIALGDSVTGGYNGNLATDSDIDLTRGNKYATNSDYLSYADFIQNDLLKAGKLASYRNFATSGETIPQQKQRVFRDTAALRALQDADLITLTLGANDLLAAVNALEISYDSLKAGDWDKKINEVNYAREELFKTLAINEAKGDTGRGRDASPSGYASSEDMQNIIRESFDKLLAMLKDGNLSGAIDIEHGLIDKIFDVITLDLAVYVNEIHKAAPNAKIVVLGYALPLHQIPDSALNGIIPDRDLSEGAQGRIESNSINLNGRSLSLANAFKELIFSVKKAVENANYIKFFDINDFKEFTDKSDDVSWILYGDKITDNKIAKRGKEWDRVMANPIDIHPSTYGHQVIAGHLYEWIADDMKLEVPKYQSIQKLDLVKDDWLIKDLEKTYTYASDVEHNYHDDGFFLKDENVKYDHYLIQTIFKSLDDSKFLQTLEPIIEQYINGKYLSQHYKDLLDLYDKVSNDKQSTILDKVQYVLEGMKPFVFKNAAFGNVNGYTIGQFLDTAINMVKGLDKTNLNTTGSIQDTLVSLVDPTKVNGIKVLEMAFASMIYFGDTGQGIKVDLTGSGLTDTPILYEAKEYPSKNDKNADGIRFLAKNFRNNLYDLWLTRMKTEKSYGSKEYLTPKESDSPNDDSIGYLLSSWISINVGTPILNLQSKAGSAPVQWLDDAGNSHFAELIDEIAKVGKEFGMDISATIKRASSSKAVAPTPIEKDNLGVVLFAGDALGNKWINSFMANMGVDTTRGGLWNRRAFDAAFVKDGISLDSSNEDIIKVLTDKMVHEDLTIFGLGDINKPKGLDIISNKITLYNESFNNAKAALPKPTEINPSPERDFRSKYEDTILDFANLYKGQEIQFEKIDSVTAKHVLTSYKFMVPKQGFRTYEDLKNFLKGSNQIPLV